MASQEVANALSTMLYVLTFLKTSIYGKIFNVLILIRCTICIYFVDIACTKQEPKEIRRLLLNGRESSRCAVEHGCEACPFFGIAISFRRLCGIFHLVFICILTE